MRKQLLTLTLATVMIASSLSPVYAGVTPKKDYITGKEYVKLLEKSMREIKYIKKKKLSLKGIKLGKKVSYTDACVLANRADILIHGDDLEKEKASDYAGSEVNNGLKDITYSEVPSVTIDGRIVTYTPPSILNKNIVKYKRIANLNKIPKAKRNAVISCYRKGIFVGDGVKKYESSVNLGTKKYLTKKQAKMIAKHVLGREWGGIRRELTPDGQLIRTANLPKKAKLFPYVVEGLPNEFYDAKFSWEELEDKLPVYFPRNVERSSLDEQDNLAIQKNRFVLAERVKKSLEVRFNVDYRTVDDNWVKKASRIYHGETGTEVDRIFLDFINNIYLPNIKKNKVVIKSKRIIVDPYSLHRNKNKEYTYRCYVEFTTWGTEEAYQDQTDLFLCNRKMHLPILENGKAIKLVFDISLGHSVNASSEVVVENYYPTEDSLSANWEAIK